MDGYRIGLLTLLTTEINPLSGAFKILGVLYPVLEGTNKSCAMLQCVVLRFVKYKSVGPMNFSAADMFTIISDYIMLRFNYVIFASCVFTHYYHQKLNILKMSWYAFI